GVVGAGKIGSVVLKMISGFGSKLLACDPIVNLDIVQRYGVTYVGMDEILKSSDVISLNCPLNEDNYHLINDDACKIMKYGAILVNTGRGELVDSIAVLSAMKSKKIRCFCTDVIEKEHILMKQKVSDVFQNREEHQIYTTFRSLKRQKNFLFTGHKAFLTQTSLMNIADITLHNIDNFKNGRPLKYQLT
ncbi:NAD(P)-dependent oxidoreductase, partial [Candidatus Riesia pediculischaeffi]|uniref:NAD(P)-dependent oxidoreductase n=1 Tax=Candidatus Riesia pediculischaeffi TaxID=428411 RepID=UPI0024100028